MKKLLIFFILLNVIAYSQAKSPVFSKSQKDSINAYIVNYVDAVGADTILTGIATINVGLVPTLDSVVVTYNHYETDPPSDTGKVIISPLSDMKGFNYWIEWATSEQFEIKIGDIGYEAFTSPVYFRYYAIVRKR